MFHAVGCSGLSRRSQFHELESAKALVYEIQVDQPHVRRRPTLKLGDACLDQFVRVSQPAFVLGENDRLLHLSGVGGGNFLDQEVILGGCRLYRE